jgi:hypothetical protein
MKFIIFIILILILLILINSNLVIELLIIPQKIYLISNDKKINTKVFKQINPNDLLIFMNTAYFSDNKYLKNNKKLLFIRHNKNSFFGYKENFNNKYNKIYFVHNSKYNYNLPKKRKNEFHQLKDSKKFLKTNKIIKYYPKNKVPTTGFVTYNYIKKKYPNSNIYLIGFYGQHKKYKGWDKHDFEYEQKYYRNNKVKKIN